MARQGKSARPGVGRRPKTAVSRSTDHRAATLVKHTKSTKPSPKRPAKVTKVKVSVKGLTSVTPKAAPPPGGGASAFAKAMRYLQKLADFERMRILRYTSVNFDLDRMRNLLKRLGNPQDSFRSVHIAGTKGKGSTCAMIHSMLVANGYRVGLYTSPHLVDVRERIQINGEMISQADFARLVRVLEPLVEKTKPTPTYFDVLTALAFKYFAEQKVDIVVAETGLGGRLDSTNVLKPEVSAITSISMDHMAQLGPTLAHIAAEKAGIFKPGVPALTVVQPAEVEQVMRRQAEQVGAPFDVVGKSVEFSYRFEATRMGGPQSRICLTTPLSKFEHLSVPLMGEHQAINCGLALSVIDRLKTRGLVLDDGRTMEGLAKTTIPGRMEIISAMPRILVDCAHNSASLDACMRAIGQHITYDSMVVIFGCCADKDVGGMLERLSYGADKVIFTRINNVRTADPEELSARYVEQYGKMAQIAQNLQEAMAIALRAVTREDLICITGSVYLVGEAKQLLQKNGAIDAGALAK